MKGWFLACALAIQALPVGAGPAHGAAPDSPLDACAHAPDAVRINLEIVGIRFLTGTVTVVLYDDDPDDFLARGKRLNRIRIPVEADVVRGCMTAPTPGRYAIAFYHDQNGDRKLGRTLLGLPDEGFGFSNDAPSVFGLPRFKDVLFTAASGDNHLKATMRY